jgi:hypothetical protein
MKIAIYQDNLGSASGIHWWLSQEINVGPEVYSFTDGYLRPAHNHIGGIVIEDGMHPHHNLYNSTFTELDKTENTLIDPFAKMEEMTKDFDTILWSNYSGNLANPDNIIKADKTILVDNSIDEQLFFYITNYAFAWIETVDDVHEQTKAWAEEHSSIEGWSEEWYGKYHDDFVKAWEDKKLKYMWQLNFAHHDLADNLNKYNNKVVMSDPEDHERLITQKREELTNAKSDETLFSYANNEVSHLVVGDEWFNEPAVITDYLDIMSSFRLKKFLLDYVKMYKRKRGLYNTKFTKLL